MRFESWLRKVPSLLVDTPQNGPVFTFAEWPSDQVPRRTAGVYTVWRQDEFIYVGMSGRGEPSPKTLSPGLISQARPWAYGRGSAHMHLVGGRVTSSVSRSSRRDG